MIEIIENMTEKERDELMEIWLYSNQEAHDFISPDYWEIHFESVKASLPLAKIIVYKRKNKISGFLGLSDNYIAGLFVSSSEREKGIGTQLLNEAKKKSSLMLHVYQKNKGAVAFYNKHGFKKQEESIDSETMEIEEYLVWKRK
ncbi:GNAT family N-acetyltransferase [Vagococcus sp.]|uniref:GNAT family N-acetyltransferase n=1 Tax=Vagococcus sp. TaxID=1933889 RepID=UPI003F985C8C